MTSIGTKAIAIQVHSKAKALGTRKFQIGKAMANEGHCTKKTFSVSLVV